MKVAKIRTSDRIAFKRCRRKWDFSSGIRQNLGSSEARAPLWLGTGFHFAMEDFHGERKFAHPIYAWRKYVEAVKLAYQGTRLPETWEQDSVLAESMLDYYVEWLKGRDPLRTFEYKGKKQVEVRFEIPIPLDPEYVKSCGYDKVVYQGTLDRVVIDEHDRLWVLDYKTAKQFALEHLTTDPQITSYCWIGSVLYDRPITGFIYQQHKKAIIEPPKVLQSGEFSVAKSQSVTHRSYRKAMIDKYGNVDAAPLANINFLNYLAVNESIDGDALIRRDYEFRNEHHIAAEGQKIIQEAADMINPNLPLYPNPTRDCSWDCDLKDVCLMMDDGSDWQEVLAQLTVSREESDLWRNFI